MMKSVVAAFAVGGMVLASARAAEPLPALRGTTKGAFLIGTAVRPDLLTKPQMADLISSQFDCMTAENVMKPIELQPRPGEFNFGPADAIVKFAADHNMTVIGHTLCWHGQAPAWLFRDAAGKPLAREQGLTNLRAHITAVLTHFKGKCRGWDVVNEALSDDPKTYLRDSPAQRCIGDDFIIQAFKIAHEVDPDVELYYNDYSIDDGHKLAKVVRLVNELKAAGCRIDGVGNQAHWLLNEPSAATIEKGLLTIAATGVKVHFTELDVDVLPRRGRSANITDVEKANGSTQQNPYVGGLPPDIQQKLAERYGAIFDVFKKHQDKVERVTFWGVDDGMSWLNGFPIRGRTNHPLLFDRQLQPKPAFFSVIKALEGK